MLNFSAIQHYNITLDIWISILTTATNVRIIFRTIPFKFLASDFASLVQPNHPHSQLLQPYLPVEHPLVMGHNSYLHVYFEVCNISIKEWIWTFKIETRFISIISNFSFYYFSSRFHINKFSLCSPLISSSITIFTKRTFEYSHYIDLVYVIDTILTLHWYKRLCEIFRSHVFL